MTDFGKRLKKLRRDSEMTQIELASKLGVVTSAVGKYERLPHSYPSVEGLIKIADIFNVSIDWLLRGTERNATIKNSINGGMNNSSFVQANHGGVVLNTTESLSPEAAELFSVYEKLNGRDRISLINFAYDLERKE